ncbi:MAG TPA: ribonuclease catalytic domain-containing protein, partial [Vicinamibacterales bacterium]|nr:ribonuclease catalytic domain-containing protein [Vicinamibacterales bacterium]
MQDASRHIDLQAAAASAMRAHGFEPEFSPQVLSEVAALEAHPPPIGPGDGIRDLRRLPWSSIDNDTSRDLDQLEVAERLPDGATRIQVAIADVDAFVRRGSAIDDHAARATTTVYTGVRNFPMLPEALSTRATSLLESQDNLSVVIEFVVASDGAVRSSDVYRAVVCNTGQLTYDGVAGWFEGGPAPHKVAASPALQSQLRLQDEAAQLLRQARYRHGALNIETIETRPVVLHGQVVDIVRQGKNRATELIE